MEQQDHSTKLEPVRQARARPASAITVTYDPASTAELRRDLLHALDEGACEIVLVVRPSGTIAAHDLELIEAVGTALADRGGGLLTLTGDTQDAEAFLVRELRGGQATAHEGRSHREP